MTRREEIEQQAKSYTLAVFDELEDFSDVTQAYIDGAEWMQETRIEKAWDWFYSMALDYMQGDITDIKWGSMKEDFFKAMEE